MGIYNNWSEMPHTERNVAIFVERTYGTRTLKSLGDEYGITSARVRQIELRMRSIQQKRWMRLFDPRLQRGLVIGDTSVNDGIPSEMG